MVQLGQAVELLVTDSFELLLYELLKVSLAICPRIIQNFKLYTRVTSLQQQNLAMGQFTMTIL